MDHHPACGVVGRVPCHALPSAFAASFKFEFSSEDIIALPKNWFNSVHLLNLVVINLVEGQAHGMVTQAL